MRSRPPNRQIYWMEEANRHLANWLYVREILVKRCPDRKCNPKALFVSTSSWSIGRRPHRHTVGAAITQYAREAGITENISMTMNWIPPACDVIDVDNVGMAKSRCCLGLLYEPPLSFGIGDFLGRENFDGDEPVQVRVAGLVHQTRPTAAERFEDLIVQDGASDHGTTRNFGMRVKLIRGNEFDGLNARPGGRYSCRTLTWMSASGVGQKSVALNGRIGMGQPCCLRSGSVLVNAVHRIKRPF